METKLTLEKLTCKNHLYEKAIKAMYEVKKKGRKHNLSISCQLDLFDKLVKPILLYGSEIWGFGNNDINNSSLMKYWLSHKYERPHSFNILST
jgi:hypothetical protein